MRPESIRRFDMFYLGSVALSVVDFVLEHDAVMAQTEAQSRAAQVSLGAGFVNGGFAVWTALMVLLWFFAAHRRSNVAKWIIVLLAVIGLWGLPALVTGSFTTAKIVSLLSFMLSWVAVYFLFRADAKAWFGKSESDGAAAPVGED
jgi:hypothetical protein